MRAVAILGASVAFLAGSGTAQANVPSATWQQDALSAAQSYWHNGPPWDPACQMTVSYQPLDLSEAGETDNNCDAVINSNLDWIDPETLCLTVTHEVGHIILGPDAFPENTADPAHSTNPSNIMYPVIFDAKTPQCSAMLNKEFPVPKRHRHRRWRHWQRSALPN